MGHGVRYLCPMPEPARRRFLLPLQGVGFLAVFFELSDLAENMCKYVEEF